MTGEGRESGSWRSWENGVNVFKIHWKKVSNFLIKMLPQKSTLPYPAKIAPPQETKSSNI